MEAVVELTPQQRDEEAKRLLNEGDFNKAIETIQPLEQFDPNYCHYFKARVDFRRNNSLSALTHLTKVTDDPPSELLADVFNLAKKKISDLAYQQFRRASELFDEGSYNNAKRIINSLQGLGIEPQFCHFMLGKIAQKENNLRLAVEHLVHVTNIKENNSVIKRDFYTPAQKMLAEILNEQAEIARAALNICDFNSAKTAISIIEACNTESTFCNYIKAEIAHKEGGKTSAELEYLGLSVTENTVKNKNKSLITFDTHNAIQHMLVGLVTGQLKTKSKYKAQFIPVDDPYSQTSHVSLDSEDDFRTENIDVFIKVTRLQGFGIRFHFTKALSLESQLRVLENLKTLYAETKQDMPSYSHLDVTLFGEDIKSEAQFLQYLAREQALIKGHIAAEKGLWAQAHAYYYQASSFGVYKEELEDLRAFYFDEKTDMKINDKFTHEQCYAILQSLFINNFIDTETYVRWLYDLRCIIIIPPLPPEHEVDDHESLETAEGSAIGDNQPLPPEKEPRTGDNNNNSWEEDETLQSETPQLVDTPPLSKEDQKLVGKIQKQILLFDSVLKTENAIETENWLPETKFTQTKKLVYGEDLKDYSKRFFDSAWNLSRFKPLNALAVFFAAFAFLPALAHKKYQLNHKAKRSAEQISKDNEALDARRTEMRDAYFKKARHKESIATSKRHLMLKPLEQLQIQRAAALQFQVPKSPAKK